MGRVRLPDLAESSDKPCLQSDRRDVLAAPEAAATAPPSRCSSPNPVLRRRHPALRHSPHAAAELQGELEKTIDKGKKKTNPGAEAATSIIVFFSCGC